MTEMHIPNDPYNCLCADCVHAALMRMGLPYERGCKKGPKP